MMDENEPRQDEQDQDKPAPNEPAPNEQAPNEPAPKPDAADAGSSKPQTETLDQMKATVKALGLQDKMILFGSLALAVLFLLPWWSVSVNFMGAKQTNSINGLHDAAWLGWIAAIVATVLSLTKVGILKAMPPAVVSASKNTVVFVVLTVVALLVGPLYFWSTVGGDVPTELARTGAIDAGKTLFFFLAFLAALAAAAGAVWKLVEERKASSQGEDDV